jgi:hypothetical protein
MCSNKHERNGGVLKEEMSGYFRVEGVGNRVEGVEGKDTITKQQ